MDKTTREAGITVQGLIDHLKMANPNAQLIMGGLEFYRVKTRGPELVQIEFNQMVHQDEDGDLIFYDNI